MYFRQILQTDLGCASYLIADGGEAVVVDPRWDIEPYLEAAEELGARIRHVLETHNHADHVSGRRRLLSATGAIAHTPADPGDEESAGLREGDLIAVGEVEIRVMAAPGHRPEHLAFLVVDRSGREPERLLSGDSLLVGGVARPDLAVAASDGAAALFETLQRLGGLGDEVEVWPAHVGGSLCGSGSLTDATFSTIGDELRHNRLLGIAAREDFIHELTSSSPVRPPRVARIVELNTSGPPEAPPLPELDAGELMRLGPGGACVLDVRDAESYDRAHLSGSLNLPAESSSAGNRAAWATDPEEPIVIVADTASAAAAFAHRLLSAGLWNLRGVLVADPEAWRAAGLTVESGRVLTPVEVAQGLSRGELELVDVRDESEWRLGHVDGARHLPLPVLADGRGVDLPADRPLAVACAAGARAALAASVLRRQGYSGASRMTGGIPELLRSVPLPVGSQLR
ncbi:MAG TPA: MBL fold metallo-hydrolase [Solirubrobacteraceae bacterium]|nr:MBL fold metallo-hydrolase [Solirubrobacteraceae bacterium]